MAAREHHNMDLISRFARAREGVSAVEFALVLPFLILLYLGGTELSHAITVDRKLTAMTSSVADLVSQAAVIENAEMNGIFNAVSAILAPYSANDATVVVSSIKVDSNGVAKVDWSDGFHKAARAKGSTVTLPAGIAEKGTTIIMAEGTYTYSPQFGAALTGPVNLSDSFYLRPRVTDSIQRTN
ncbi:MAG: pilus assembly protein [Rhodobiaceae bacterium]|nr:pilus assembly protein [Rhodobiaceae bacterium]MCC0055147.1 pilus assembly protein [Rhodobiaceae bacterium]